LAGTAAVIAGCALTYQVVGLLGPALHAGWREIEPVPA
jgi:hypothetical protein